MGLFGQLDAANIKTNPGFVEAGTYHATITEAKYRTFDNGGRQLVITYQIDDEESQYLDKKVSQKFNLPDPEMTPEQFELLPPDEKKKLDGILSSLKRTLCGNRANARQQGLGVDPDDLNREDWNPEVVVGSKVIISISNWGEEGVNVKWVNLAD